MPSIFNAQLSELGTSYLVNNVILTEAKYVLPNAKYIALPNEVALYLKNQLNQGNVITIPKEKVDGPNVRDIPLEDFDIKEPKTLDQLKSQARSKVTQRISAYTALLTAFDIFEFTMISGKLQAMGYSVLNTEKQEEVYLAIIETGDEDLITDLERFLEVKDIFDTMMKKYRGLKQYFREINDCDTEEELKEVVETNRGWLVN
jgi:hypothetical protein